MEAKKEKWGLALEGGGARGAYQVGAYQALQEMGYEFDVICGTSIGAVNGAAFVQGDPEMAERIWLELSNQTLFGVDDATYERILKLDLEGSMDKAVDLIKSVVQQRGLPLAGMERLFANNLSEEKIRASAVEFGLVTLSLPDMTPHQLFRGDIPEGKLLDYVMASANHPAFQRLVIDDKAFIDGGAYNNLPIDMLDQQGCTRVVAIRLHGIGIVRKHREDLPVLTIEPRENLGSVLDFNGDRAGYRIRLGYYDAMRSLQGLKGNRYYVRSRAKKLPVFLNVEPDVIDRLRELMRLSGDVGTERFLLEQILPRMFRYLDLDERADYEDLFFALLEWGMDARDENRFKIYTEEEFLMFARENAGSAQGQRSGPFSRRRQEAAVLLREAVLAAYGRIYEESAAR